MRPSLRFGALLGAITSLPVMGLLFLGKQVIGSPFIPFDIFDSLARTLPGGLVTAFIDTNVRVIRLFELGQTSDVAKLIEQILALAATLLIGALVGIAIALVLRLGRWSGAQIGAVAGFLVLLVALIVEMGRGLLREPSPAVIWLAVLIVSWGAFLGVWLDPRLRRGGRVVWAEHDRAGRRAFLRVVAGISVAVAASAWGLGRLLESGAQETGAGRPLPQPPTLPTAIAGPTAIPNERMPAPGSRPSVTANKDFYQVDIDLRPPAIMGSTWALDVRGLFDRPRTLGLPELMAFEAITQPITLSCISNPIGGDLIGNAYWTGLRLRDLMRDLGLGATAKRLYVESEDGFYETVEMADLLDSRTLLVYGMNGVSLPIEHGFPLRILIPNRYGMKQPKWIKRIEAIDWEGAGYWVERGWSKEAHPQILSIIDTVAKDSEADGKVPVGGIAWAGDRGILRVEIQVDGEDWVPATILPAAGPLSWVDWRYDWPRALGRHTIRVRATDGAGALQTANASDPHPNGATGYHTVTVSV